MPKEKFEAVRRKIIQFAQLQPREGDNVYIKYLEAASQVLEIQVAVSGLENIANDPNLQRSMALYFSKSLSEYEKQLDGIIAQFF